MTKLKLAAEPTFKAKVSIPLPGAAPADVEFTFKHRTRDQIVEWLEKRDTSDIDSVKDCAIGWELDDEFTDENIGRLCQNYLGAGYAIVTTYLTELRGARAKN